MNRAAYNSGLNAHGPEGAPGLYAVAFVLTKTLWKTRSSSPVRSVEIRILPLRNLLS
jgi:hypothetical protein